MKVILIKKCNDGNINDIVEVNSGYGLNFLIKKGYAVPYNKETENDLNKRLKVIDKNKEQQLELALSIKSAIESKVLKYKLKTSNNQVFGSISRKQIIADLKQLGIIINSHMMENLHIRSIGQTIVKINLHKEVIAKLKVEVEDDK